jgi:uncharacterized protein YutE (UPF0331/DUF86 family)/predicted nucleotidyltransferase
MNAMDDNLVVKLRERLSTESDVLVAYLFGSRARGVAGPLSDVDVAVLLDDGDSFQRRLDLIAAVAEVTGGVAADVVVLNEAPVALGYRVVRDGVLVHSRDEVARIRYFARTVALVDPESVERRLRHLGSQIAVLRDIQGRGAAAFDDELIRMAAERALQVAVQAACDIANHILAEDTDVTPEDYGAAFLALTPLGIIDATLAERLRSAAGLRNVLVHMYVDLDPERTWAAIERIDDLVEFAVAVERYIAKAD